MTQKLKLVVFVVVFQFHWHFLRWVAGQNTQTQNTLSPKIPKAKILKGILGLGILGWNPLGDRKFNSQILELSIFIIFCSWPSRFSTFATCKN